MDRIRIALVGCGGMGTRHLYGLAELSKTPFANVELAAVCDIRPENAELAAGEAEKLLGARPQVFTDLERMARQVPDLHAVDVVVDPGYHHTVACQALDLGLHVMVEKPLAITVRGCHRIIEAARRNDRILSVAENFRRDPSARLVRHLIDGGAIGRPYMAFYHSLSPGDDVFITPWRHDKERGGLLLDLAVHFTDLIRYQLGDIDQVHGHVSLAMPVRRRPGGIDSPYEFYQRRHSAMEEEVRATAEDSSMATLRMASGAMVSWVVGLGGHGGCGGQAILGDRGALKSFGNRGGRAALQAAGQQEKSHEQLVAESPGFELEPLAAHFFPEGVATADIDWKLLALEYFELGEAILKGRTVEVDGAEGMKAVAAVYAIFESSRLGRAVTMREVENAEVYEYQAGIDAALNL